ncbi:hypothetical protein [Pleurocapsa sp. PCC 7319]|uniref:hypothetical protein n=1 Tax=Pleurocapsa sp. PCC 7319 TaxID=118161 RepID=UPI0004769B81|nr:hypothetical protein [Pleurocapsa sp. PCC 7319]
MHNCGATLNIYKSPVLPFISPPVQKKLHKITPLPIGLKIKSFKIEDVNYSRSTSLMNGAQSRRQSPTDEAIKLEATVRLPSFVHSSPIPLNIFSNQVVTKSRDFVSYSDSQPDQIIQSKPVYSGANHRFWWRWLLIVGCSILMLPLLFQTSSQASNLLEKVKMHLQLNSHQARSFPNSGRIHLQDNQASSFNRAIRKARAIEPDSPFYHQAQVDINRWSEVILDIAQGRADEEDFAGAIAAAQLIPQDESSAEFVAQEATDAILHWQLKAQRQNLYQNYLAGAKKIINPNQASSYNQAIRILRQISPGVEEYDEAQSLIRQWSKQIYLIANDRAAKGEYQQAIEAAALIPQDFPYYQQAKNSILRWQEFSSIGHVLHSPPILEN